MSVISYNKLNALNVNKNNDNAESSAGSEKIQKGSY